MELNDYQTKSRETALYDNVGHNFIYPTLGLAGETGEVIEKIKKLMRNDGLKDSHTLSQEKKDELTKEMGDVLWYLSQLATEFDIQLGDIAIMNIEKLQSRKARGTLHSEGDNR